MTKAFLIAGAAALALSGAPAAALENLSTGLDASDTLITLGNTPDAHWTVDQPLSGIAAANVVDSTNSGGAFFAWAANGPRSSWITIDPNSFGNGSVIPYTYYRSFTVASADLAKTYITGSWGIDDSGEIRLNGNLVSFLPADYSASTPFSVAVGSSFFVAGTNLLTITMTSSDNGFEAVRLEGKVATVPEPASWALMIAGFGMVGFAARRRRAVAAA